jgi:hypothetical protein
MKLMDKIEQMVKDSGLSERFQENVLSDFEKARAYSKKDVTSKQFYTDIRDAVSLLHRASEPFRVLLLTSQFINAVAGQEAVAERFGTIMSTLHDIQELHHQFEKSKK